MEKLKNVSKASELNPLFPASCNTTQIFFFQPSTCLDGDKMKVASEGGAISEPIVAPPIKMFAHL